MGRKEDLEYNIHESYQLVREYEEILQTSSDPKEKARAERAIKEQRRLIETWQAEYWQVTGQTPPEPPAKAAGLPEPSINSAATRSGASPAAEPRKSVPWSGYVMVVLLGVDLVVVAVLGWRFLGDQPELLSYLQVVTGFLGLALEILLLGIVLKERMSVAALLRWLGTSRGWQGIISLMTVGLWIVLFWPLQPASTEQAVIETPLPTIEPTASPSQSLCRLESLEPKPPSPQPVGSLVIFKIRGTCESGVRAIRLQINGEPHGEKGGHEAPPEEFVPTWATKGLPPGDYKVVAEVATWGDDDWEFAASRTLTYTLVASSTTEATP